MPYFEGKPLNNMVNWQRGVGAPGSQGIAVAASSFSVFPVQPHGNLMPGNITASTMAFALSYSFTNTSGNPTAVWSSSYRIGIYTLNGSTLSLLNSASGTFGNPAATSNASTLFNGGRLLTVHSSQWSSAPVFTDGGRYYMAMQLVPTATTTAVSVMQAAVNISTLSGLVAAAASTGTQIRPFGAFQGLFNATTTAVPGSIAESQITGMSSNAFPSPWLRLDAGFFP